MVNRGTAASGADRPSGADETVAAHLVRRLAPLTAPDAGARDRMRQRILAGLGTATPERLERPTTVTPPRATARPPRTRPAAADRGPSRPGDLPRPATDQRSRFAGARGRFAIASVALLALVLSLAGMSLLLTRDALPGDALYGIKRTAEAASLGLTFGDEPKALKHLEFAAARVTEIETLAQRYANPSDAPVGGYLTALTDFDNDASAGSRQLVALATRGDGRQLEALLDWATQQSDRLAAVTARLPDAARNREGASQDLLHRISARSDALLSRMQCYQITTGSVDDIGALPANGVCERVPGAASPSPSTGQTEAHRIEPPATAPGLTTVPGPTLPPAATLPNPGDPGQPGGSQPPGSSGAPVTTSSTSGPPGSGQPPILVLPLPLPTVELPPLLPGLPGIRLGGG